MVATAALRARPARELSTGFLQAAWAGRRRRAGLSLRKGMVPVLTTPWLWPGPRHIKTLGCWTNPFPSGLSLARHFITAISKHRKLGGVQGAPGTHHPDSTPRAGPVLRPSGVSLSLPLCGLTGPLTPRCAGVSWRLGGRGAGLRDPWGVKAAVSRAVTQMGGPGDTRSGGAGTRRVAALGLPPPGLRAVHRLRQEREGQGTTTQSDSPQGPPHLLSNL